MKICGFRKIDFVNKETGEQIAGYNLFQKLDCDNGKGFYTEKHFVSDNVCKTFGIDDFVLTDILENERDILFDKVKTRIVGVIVI